MRAPAAGGISVTRAKDAEFEFQGTARFAPRRRLGAGAFGVVYETFDREREATVALKLLTRVEPDALFRFKQEFRAIADIVHPNLVGLHELVSEGDLWFFTMELVRGTSFVEHVRRETSFADAQTFVGASAAAPLPPAAALLASASAKTSPGLEPVSPPLGPVDLERLRAALRQLAAGVSALHDAGMLHRDIKPSNVLVTPEGRVVLLDFGLVTAIEERRPADTSEDLLVGTAAYMSPEQAAAQPLTAQSDWYAVGAVLYEALTGRPPFSGKFLEVLSKKQTYEPPPPRAVAPGVPEDLDTLCVDLLRLKAEARPGGDEVLARLGVPEESGRAGGGGVGRFAQSSGAIAAAGAAALVGRARHLAFLRQAFAAAEGGAAVTVLVHGGSGMGKSALLRRFVDLVREGDRAVCLLGRCYEQETVPYKALDTLIDALCRHLVRLPRPEAEAVMPRDVLALARLFPVLHTVQAVAEAPRRAVQASDAQELRHRAFAALRELLGRLADRKPLVLSLDDLQWGDKDSAGAIADLLRPPDAPPLLVLASYRTEDAATSPPVRALLDLRAKEPSLDIRELEVGPLSVEDAREVALAVLPPERRERAEAIARESHGNPFFAAELAQHVVAAAEAGEATWRPAADGGAPAGAGGDGEPRLDDVVAARLARLPEAARRLLEVLAVAGVPVDRAVAARAAGLAGEEEPAALGVLRAGRLARVRVVRDEDRLETYHDRIRETLASRLTSARRVECHGRIAAALESTGRADPEALFVHCRGAGDLLRAGTFAEAAAEKAALALAFDRAARLYGASLELRSLDPEKARAVRARLADALANAGSGAEAARVYLEAAAGAPPDAAFELERRAGEQLLRSGHTDEGLAALGRVLAAGGLGLATTPFRALVSLLFRRARIRLRGLGFQERAESDVPAEELRRIDMCWSASLGLSLVDSIRGADLQTRHLLLALRAGEPYRVARALAMEAGYSATAGGPRSRRTAWVLEAARTLAQRVENPHAIGLVELAAGIAALLEGRFRAGRETCDGAEKTFVDGGCAGVAWELSTSRIYAVFCLFYLGEVGEMARRVRALLEREEERGDLYVASNLRSGLTNFAWLHGGDPESARSELERVARRRSREGYHIQHYYDAIASTQIDLYVGAGRAAFARLTAEWPALRRSLLLRIQHIRIVMLQLHGRAALAAALEAATTRDRKSLADEAVRDAKRLEGEDLPWSTGFGRLLRAGAASVRGDRDAARAALDQAIATFEAAGMALYAAAARARKGALEGGDTGAALVASARAFAAAQSVKEPERVFGALAPGFA